MRSGLRFRSESGQSIVIILLALPVLLLFAALVIEGGNLVVKKRQLQTAADAAALAAAQDLSSAGACGATCEATLVTYSTDNGGDSTLPACTSDTQMNCYEAPYVDKDGIAHPGLIEVRLRKTINSLFAGLLGASFHVAARAVASANPTTSTTTTPGSTTTTPGTVITTPGGLTTTPGTVTTTPGTVTTTPGSTITTYTTTTVGGEGAVAFARSTDCHSVSGTTTVTAAIEWSGAPSNIGALMANGGIYIVGNSNKSSSHIRLGRYPESGCVVLNGGTFPDVSGGFPPLGWPIPPPSPAPPPGCLSTGAAVLAAGWLATHPPGIYCYTLGTLSIGANSTVWNGYAFFAPSINVNSNGQTFTGVQIGSRMVAFDAYNGSFVMNGQSNNITGDIYAPAQPTVANPTFGTISMSGGGASSGTGGAGFMESWKLVISGNFATYAGTGPGQGGTTVTVTTVTTTPGTVTTTPGTVTTTPGGVTTTPGTVTTTPGSVTTNPPVTNTTTTGTDVNLDE